MRWDERAMSVVEMGKTALAHDAQKGPWTLDGRCMADVHFKLVVSDTAEETTGRHVDRTHR